MKKTLMLTMIMALGITASVMAAPADTAEKEVPPAEVSLARIQNAPWQELGYIEPDFDNDPMYQGNGDSDCSGDSDGDC